MSKAVTPMTDPEFKVEFDGKETYVICNGVNRRDKRWVSIDPASQFVTSSKTADTGLR